MQVYLTSSTPQAREGRWGPQAGVPGQPDSSTARDDRLHRSCEVRPRRFASKRRLCSSGRAYPKECQTRHMGRRNVWRAQPTTWNCMMWRRSGGMRSGWSSVTRCQHCWLQQLSDTSLAAHSGKTDQLGITHTRHRSIADVVAAIFGNLEELVGTEARLVTTELKEEAGRAAGPLIRISLGIALGLYGLGFFLVAAVILLSHVLQLWAAAAVVGAFVTIVAAALLIRGRRAWTLIQLTPPLTTRSLRENFAWEPAATPSRRESKPRATSCVTT